MSSFMKKKIACGSVLALAWALSSNPAIAQSASDTTADAQDSVDARQPNQTPAAYSNEITVTAQRRSQSLQDVPIAISAFSGESLDKLSIDSAIGLQRVTPGLNFQTESGSAQLTIRGVGTGYSGTGLEQSVAQYYDGAYVASQIGAILPLIDIGQVQVLKGPQGALYGRNATGGAVLIDTADPDPLGTSGYAKAGYGSHNAVLAEGMVNLPLGDNAALRVVGQYKRRDSFVFNENLSRDLYGQRSYYVRGKVLVEPSDATSIVLKAEYFNDRQEAPHINIAPDPLCSYCEALGIGLPSKFNRTYSNDFEDEIEPFVGPEWLGADTSGEIFSRVFVAGANITHSFGDIELQSVTGYRKVSQDGPYNDQDAGPLPIIINGGTIRTKAFNQELQLASQFPGDVNFVIGANYEHDKNDFLLGLAGSLFGPLIVTTENFDETNSYSVFGELYYQFLEDFTLTVGARYTKDKRRHEFINNPDSILVFGESAAVLRSSFDSFTPRAVLSYDTGNAVYYASFNRGVKAGGYNSPGYNSADPVKPEKISAYEVGAKYRLLGGRLRLDFAAFHYDWTNLQVAVIDSAGGGLAQENAAAATADGAEIAIDAELGNNFSISLNGLYLNSRYESFPSASVFRPAFLDMPGAKGQAQVSDDLRGYVTPNAPKLSGSLSLQYSGELGSSGWNLDATGSVAYKSKYDQQPGAGGVAELIRQGELALVSARIAISDPSDKYTIALSGENLTDVNYYSNRVATVDGGYGIPGHPRTVMLSVTRKF